MNEVLSLALPFFGLIFLGYGCGRIARLAEAGLAWLNFFVLYLAVPALFFQFVSRTPFEQLANASFVSITTFSAFCTFVLAFVVSLLLRRGNIPQATIAGAAGAYANVGYMGPGLTIAALGVQATVPTALIFAFDSMLFFALVPLLMALGGRERHGFPATLVLVVQRVITHPFNVATGLGVLFSWAAIEPFAALDRLLDLLKNAAAPCALFALGVTVALRPMDKLEWDIPFLVFIKLLVHPLIAWVLLSVVGGFDPVWIYTAILMASLPPALSVFVMASQYKVYVQQASTAVLVGTIASTVTVTGLLYLVQNRLIPPTLLP